MKALLGSIKALFKKRGKRVRPRSLAAKRGGKGRHYQRAKNGMAQCNARPAKGNMLCCMAYYMLGSFQKKKIIPVVDANATLAIDVAEFTRELDVVVFANTAAFTVLAPPLLSPVFAPTCRTFVNSI